MACASRWPAENPFRLSRLEAKIGADSSTTPAAKGGMSNPFYERPILNSPYEYPDQHWELDPSGQPTGKLAETRRRVSLITPVP